MFPSFVTDDKMPELKRQLKWLGFSTLSTGVYAHPSFDQNSIEETLQELDIVHSVIIFSGVTIDKNSLSALKKLVYQKWNLNSLQKAYCLFNETYAPILKFLINTVDKNIQDNGSSEQNFLLRILIIHEYRRILLQDHELSCDILPKDWGGYHANNLVKNLYYLLAEQSCYFITTELETMEGFMPAASSDFGKRFE